MTDQNDQSQPQGTLVDELGLSDLPEEKKEQLMGKMTEVILKRIFLETMYRLSESDQAGYEKMIDDNASPEELENFLKGKIPDYDDMVRKIVRDFDEKMRSLD